jgi:cytochrome c553
MSRRRSLLVLVSTFLIAAATIGLAPRAVAQAKRALDESFFAERVYPALHAAQCQRCHSDNGVASETRLEFPELDAGRDEIKLFGLSLSELIDRRQPQQSLLLRKPTKRMKHTGGQRLKPGSVEEAALVDWINYLAGLSDAQLRDARERIAGSRARGLEALAVRRLTHSQYNNTVRDLLGDQVQPASSFPKEDFVSGFKNQLEAQGISPLQAEAYGKAAERLARAAFRGGDQHGLIPGRPESPTDARCAQEFVRQFGLKAFRRPLTGSEVGRYAALCLDEARRASDFLAGATMVVEAMLQSPSFLFRVERGAQSPDVHCELASRLSYFLWDTMPSAELLRAAADGQLAAPEQVESWARRMLDDPRARTAMDEFLAQWMRFDRVLEATRDRRRFREYSAEVAAAMVEETRRLFDHLVWKDENFLEFFTAGYTFVNADLARLYGLPAPSEDFGRVEYPKDSGRSGVLGHGSFLVLTSKPVETSPTARGLFVRNRFLAQEIPPPPAGVNTVLPELTVDRPMTNRERLAVHLNSESCAGCHRLIDPIGLGFEQYNAIGAFQKKMVLQFGGGRGDESRGRRSVSKELDIDSSGYIQGMENSEFSTPRELGRLLAASPACQKAIVKQLFRYAFGRQETVNDQPIIDTLMVKFRDSGFRFRELIVALTTSELFLQKGSG